MTSLWHVWVEGKREPPWFTGNRVWYGNRTCSCHEPWRDTGFWESPKLCGTKAPGNLGYLKDPVQTGRLVSMVALKDGRTFHRFGLASSDWVTPTLELMLATGVSWVSWQELHPRKAGCYKRSLAPTPLLHKCLSFRQALRFSTSSWQMGVAISDTMLFWLSSYQNDDSNNHLNILSSSLNVLPHARQSATEKWTKNPRS